MTLPQSSMSHEQACCAGRPGLPPDQAAIWLQAFVQLMTAMATHFTGMTIDYKFQQIDVFSFWTEDLHRFTWYLLIIATVGGSRQVLFDSTTCLVHFYGAHLGDPCNGNSTYADMCCCKLADGQQLSC